MESGVIKILGLAPCGGTPSLINQLILCGTDEYFGCGDRNGEQNGVEQPKPCCRVCMDV